MSSVLSALRHPEHTGERRCWPCTIANGALLALAVIAVARTRRRALAALLMVVGTAAIALRGYFIPYTPQFAPRLARRLPGDPFGVENPIRPRPPEPPADASVAPNARETTDGPDTHSSPETHSGPETSHSLTEEGPDGEAVLTALFEAGVLVDDGETIALTNDSRERWRTEMDTLRQLDMDALAAVVGETAPTADALSVEGDGGDWVVLTDETGSIGRGVWLSRPVAIAETAAVRALADDLDFSLRLAAARPLRMFLETCPVCGGPVSETTTLDCCGGLSTPNTGPQDVLACEACDEWLFTFPPEES